MSSNKITVETPWGEISYSGKLDEKTVLTMPNGNKIPFYSFISHTQGDCLPYFVKPESDKTDKVSLPNDDIWDKLQFEWVEE